MISPDFIPHKHFHKGSWLIEKDNPDWYYFYPKRINHFNYGNDFYSTLDNSLKDVVKYLHEINLNTTPSCSGHFYPEKSFEKIYDKLKKQETKINKQGLVLQNPETGEFYKYRNEDYSLPWGEETFLSKAEDYQKKGCLGIKSPNKLITNILKNNNIDGFKKVFDNKNNVIVFLTKSNDSKERDQKWDYFTEKIKNMF